MTDAAFPGDVMPPLSEFEWFPLRTARLALRPLRHEDAPDLFEIFSDPAVMRYWSEPPWTSIEPARAMIAQDIPTMQSVQTTGVDDYVRFGIERVEDGRLLGTCTLFDVMPQCRRAELGYALASSAWGRGYMTEALGALLAFGFERVNLHRVEADIDPRNHASARLLERLGFQKEGLLRERWIVENEVSDTAFYGLLFREWRANNAR